MIQLPTKRYFGLKCNYGSVVRRNLLKNCMCNVAKITVPSNIFVWIRWILQYHTKTQPFGCTNLLQMNKILRLISSRQYSHFQTLFCCLNVSTEISTKFNIWQIVDRRNDEGVESSKFVERKNSEDTIFQNFWKESSFNQVRSVVRLCCYVVFSFLKSKPVHSFWKLLSSHLWRNLIRSIETTLHYRLECWSADKVDGIISSILQK